MLLPSYFQFYCPVKIVSGHKALDNLPHELDQLGALKPLIVTDQGVAGAGLVKRVTDAFSESEMSIGAIFDKVPPNSSIEVVNELADVYRDNRCDSLVAVGGGSVIDTAKGANIVITENSDDIMKFAGADILKKPMKPLIVIPTTCGTGSEVTQVAVIADNARNTKMAFASQHLYPKVAILDTRMTLTLPPGITAATAMDALTHAIESIICIQKNPLSDVFAKAAIELISENIINVVKNGKDKKGRLALANASCMAGAAFANSMVGMIHSLGHALGGVCETPHGIAMNIFLPHGLEFNLEKSEKEIGELLLYLAGPEKFANTPADKRAVEAIGFIRELRDQLFELVKLPRTLKEAGVPEEKFEEIAQKAIDDGSVIFNPVEVEFDDAMRVLEAAYE